MPFSGSLAPDNRWVILARSYHGIFGEHLKKQMNSTWTGCGGLNPRVASGALIIKYICDLSDRETVQQIRENVYMLYFTGYSSFSSAPAFDPSLFVELRTRLGRNVTNLIKYYVSLPQKRNDPT
jgi:hypothetical protein